MDVTSEIHARKLKKMEIYIALTYCDYSVIEM